MADSEKIIHKSVNYLEFAARDMAATKAFFSTVFAWSFVDYGPEYMAFTQPEKGIEGGFYQADVAASQANGAPLVVFYSAVLEQTLQEIEQAGGLISQAIFDFPGGRRFHFTEPSGNEFAVWSDC